MNSHCRFLAGNAREHFLPTLLLCLFGVVGWNAKPVHSQVDVWIDPGHCCLDPGAPGFNGSAPPDEMDFNIDVATYLQGDLLSLFYLAFKTVNHPTSFFTPADRARIANGQIGNDDADQGLCRLLVSIHMNADDDESAKGTETYYSPIKYYGLNTRAHLGDIAAATYVHPALVANANVKFLGCSQDRGIKANDFAVLRGAIPPALLQELCFISNGCQWNYILQSGTQAFLADGIAAGISQYLGSLAQAGDQQLKPYQVETRHEFAGAPPVALIGRAPVSLLQEDFEGTTFPPTGWITQSAGLPLPHAWHRTTDPEDVGNGSGSAYVGSESPSNIDEWLISPAVPLAAPDDAIKFIWSGSKYWSSVVNASLSIREAGTSPWTQLWSLSGDEPAADPFIYRERTVDLTAWLGMNVEFGFRVTGADGASFALDDIAVGDFTPTAVPPNDVCASAISLSGLFDIQGVTCYAANDLDPYTTPPSQSCVADHLAGPDVFFEITAAWGDSIHAEVASGWGAGVYLVDDCLAPVCITGGYAEDGRTSATVDHRFAPGGTFYLVVDGLEGSCGPYELSGRYSHHPLG